MEKSGLSNDDLDEGCIILGGVKDTKNLVDILGKLRLWEREAKVKMPSSRRRR